MREFLLYIERLDRIAFQLFRQFYIEETANNVLIITPSLDYKRWVLEYISKRLQAYTKTITVKSQEEVNKKDTGVLDKFRFENFIVGSGTKIAYETCYKLTQNPQGEVVYIYGPTGSGKTHLLHAIGNSLTLNGFSVRLFSGLDFYEQMVKHVKAGEIDKFRATFSKTQALLIDDVQLLSGKSKTQIELLMLIDNFTKYKRPVVLTSDCHPSEIRDISDKLISRFSGGFLFEIFLDESAKRKLIEQKLIEAGLEPKEPYIQHVFDNTAFNAIQIEGFIRTLKLTGIRAVPQLNQRLRNTLSQIAKFFGLGMEELLGASRERRVSKARLVTVYLLRHLLGLSHQEISSLFGKKGHTWAVNSLKRLEMRKKLDKQLAYTIEVLEKTLAKKGAI
ncbi:MAG: DnaA/Hda family protein [Aquificaceae bacterium]